MLNIFFRHIRIYNVIGYWISGRIYIKKLTWLILLCLFLCQYFYSFGRWFPKFCPSLAFLYEEVLWEYSWPMRMCIALKTYPWDCVDWNNTDIFLRMNASHLTYFLFGHYTSLTRVLLGDGVPSTVSYDSRPTDIRIGHSIWDTYPYRKIVLVR